MMGSNMMIPMSLVRAVVHASVQENVVPFFSRFVSSLAMSVNPGMKGCWNSKMPSVLWTSLTDFNIVGQSLMPAILLGLMVISPCSSRTPRKLTSGCSKTHFDSLRKYECSLKMSSKQ